MAASLLMLNMTMAVVPDDDDGLILRERLQMAVDRASVDAYEIVPASVGEIGEGAYLPGVSLVETDGGLELVPPDGTDCTLTATDPEALVTLTFWRFTSSPTLIFYNQFGLALSLTATEAIDIDSDSGLDVRGGI